MTTAISVPKGHRDLKKAVESFYKIATPEEINKIRSDILRPSKSLDQRKKFYIKHKKTLSLLKPLFKKIKKAHIQIARDQGFRSYLDFRLENGGVSKKKFDFFLTNVDVVIKDINKNLPVPRDAPPWYWSEFNIPDALDLVPIKKYELPEYVYKVLIEKIDSKLEKYIPRIKVEKILRDLYPRAKYNEDKKIAEIEIDSRDNIYSLLTLVHELGHAIDFLKLADKGIDPLSKSRYRHEKEACRFKFRFEDKALPKRIRKAARGDILHDFVSTLFEYDIYTNPEQDFDKAYARANNRCYPGKSKQKSNPFYLLENGFIFRPCGTLFRSIVQAELLFERLRDV